MEELHYPGLWKLFHVQLQRKHWRGKIFKAFFLESSFSSKVAKVTVTGSGNGLVLEMFLDQVLFKRCKTLIHHNKPFVFVFHWIHIILIILMLCFLFQDLISSNWFIVYCLSQDLIYLQIGMCLRTIRASWVPWIPAKKLWSSTIVVRYYFLLL